MAKRTIKKSKGYGYKARKATPKRVAKARPSGTGAKPSKWRRVQRKGPARVVRSKLVTVKGFARRVKIR